MPSIGPTPPPSAIPPSSSSGWSSAQLSELNSALQQAEGIQNSLASACKEFGYPAPPPSTLVTNIQSWINGGPNTPGATADPGVLDNDLLAYSTEVKSQIQAMESQINPNGGGVGQQDP